MYFESGISFQIQEIQSLEQEFAAVHITIHKGRRTNYIRIQGYTDDAYQVWHAIERKLHDVERMEEERVDAEMRWIATRPW